MPTNHNSELVKSQTGTPEDEIELIDILRIIWNWKYLVIFGTAICALVAMIISFNLQPIYQVSMVLKSGINKIGADGKPAYLNSVEDFEKVLTLTDSEREALYPPPLRVPRRGSSRSRIRSGLSDCPPCRRGRSDGYGHSPTDSHSAALRTPATACRARRPSRPPDRGRSSNALDARRSSNRGHSRRQLESAPSSWE